MLEGLTGFTIILVVAIAVALVIMAIGNDLAPKSPDTPGKLAPYACGEDMPSHLMQPDYSQFFPFAFFFTVIPSLAPR